MRLLTELNYYRWQGSESGDFDDHFQEAYFYGQYRPYLWTDFADLSIEQIRDYIPLVFER